jgi:aminobenzoyl-glutamate transport protein
MTESNEPNAQEKQSVVFRVLAAIERAGNVLPHPAMLFVILAMLVIIVSAVVSFFGVSVVHPGTKQEIQAVSLMTVDGLHRILTSLVTNFTGFAPLGTVLVALLGIAVAEASGFISAVLRLIVLKAPAKLLTFIVVSAGVMSSVAADVGYVVLIPLGGMVFLAVGRNPIVGIAAAFAGVSGGFSANLLLGTVDALLAGISQEAAQILNPEYVVPVTANYYFMIASTFLVGFVGTWVTEKIVAPRLGEYAGDEKEEISALTADERRGLLWALLAALVMTGLILWGLVPENGFLRDPKTGSALQSPFISGIVAIIFLVGLVLGLAYGWGAKTIKGGNDVMIAMEDSMKTMAAYLVLAFFAAQFVAFFNWTNLGLITAVKGAELIQALQLGGVLLLICVIIMTFLLNLLIGSASAKWAVMAPVFVPMLMILGFSPEMSQAAYRIGDSTGNIITPLMPYFPLVVAFAQKYDKNVGIGTVIAMMLPYSVAFFIAWSILLVIWYFGGFPLGPGTDMFYTMPAG